MKVYRYNAEKREDRRFNTCGQEKNPLAVKFYASNLQYAENYRFVCTRDGEVIYECQLETAEIENVNLFDMNADFLTLTTYRNYADKQIAEMVALYTEHATNAKLVRDRKMFLNFANAEKIEQGIITGLICAEFQHLSDNEIQLQLVAELKALGFDGYTTKNEIAIF